MATSVAAALSLEAAKKGLSIAIESINGYLKASPYQQFKAWRAQIDDDLVFQRIRTVRMVKTILSLEESVDLAQFYYPTRVLVTDAQESPGPSCDERPAGLSDKVQHLINWGCGAGEIDLRAIPRGTRVDEGAIHPLVRRAS